MHLFISHSTKDGASEAMALVAALERVGHRCWLAPRDVKAGVPYPGQIVAAIENAAGLVLLLTPGANESPDVLQEVALASAARKIIAPVMLCATAPAPDLRYYVGVRHRIAWNGAGSAVAALVDTFGVGAESFVPHANAETARCEAESKVAQVAELQRRRTANSEFSDAEGLPLMVTIPAGNFSMGSSPDEEGHRDNESPQHGVLIAHPFALGKFPVTFDEWDSAIATGAKLHRPRDEGWGRGRRPVINVSWEDAQAYIAWLNQTRPLADPYRLPSEAEWEYACRANSATRWSFGDDESQLDAHAWFVGNSESKTHPVGEKPANQFGLHDMHGNVWEWVQDGYAGDYSGPASNSSESRTKGSRRVVRGGCWNGKPQWLRSAFRFWYPPSIRFYYLGFRLAQSL